LHDRIFLFFPSIQLYRPTLRNWPSNTYLAFLPYHDRRKDWRTLFARTECDGCQSCCDNVKIQNNVSLYTGVMIEDDVFLGPSCVFTNVINPRSQINRKSEYQRTLVRRGATIGANATIVCGAMIGRYAFIGAGAVVRGDVPDYALMLGVPAKQKGWMSRHGYRLPAPDAHGVMHCPESGWSYKEEAGVLRCLDWSEDLPL
jgi:UDP-2-acetamido-3-amino-2,3-dideoxy-glucuronate N-acetyltransferase